MKAAHETVKGRIGKGRTRLLKEIVDQMRKRDDLVVITPSSAPDNERDA